MHLFILQGLGDWEAGPEDAKLEITRHVSTEVNYMQDIFAWVRGNACGKLGGLMEWEKKTLPLVTPKLETDEEFPVVRAKKRPVIVIRVAPGEVEIPPLPGGPRLGWPLAVILPAYSVARRDGRAKFPREFIDRVRKLEYPQFFFLPDCPGALNLDSLAQLTRISNVNESHLEPTQWKLSDEALDVLLGQVRHYFNGAYEGKYADAREMLLHP